MNVDSANKKLPFAGQCDSTGSSTTVSMVHSAATMILPFIEQTQRSNRFDTRYDTAGSGGSINAAVNRVLSSGSRLHPEATGRSYDDSACRDGKSDATDVVAVKWLVGAKDGQATPDL